MPDIECFFDCSSPWTYFAFHNLLSMQKELGIEIAWRPILVGGVFNAVNPSVHNSREKPVPAKTAYNKKDQQDWARHLGIPMAGGFDSLNVAVTSGIVLHHLAQATGAGLAR